jgi:cytochrome b involved in lipid metabolism
MIPNLEKLRQNGLRYKELLPQIYRELDPKKKLQTHLLWLMAMPRELAINNACDLVLESLKSLPEAPSTLEELAKTNSSGTIFEVVETGQSYQLVGFMNNGIAVREFNSELIIEMDKETIITRVF